MAPASPAPERSPAPDATGTININRGPADVPYLAPKTWAGLTNLGSLLAIVACLTAAGLATFNWRSTNQLDAWQSGLHVPAGAGNAFYVGHDAKNHYVDTGDSTVAVPNYYYKWADCHTGGYACSPAELEHAFWSRLYSGNMPSVREVKSVLKRWRTTLSNTAQAAGASVDEAADIADQAVRDSYERALELEDQLEQKLAAGKARLSRAQDSAETELTDAKNNLVYKLGWYSQLPWYQRAAAKSAHFIGTHVPGMSWLLPAHFRTWNTAKNMAAGAASTINSAWEQAKDTTEDAADTAARVASRAASTADDMASRAAGVWDVSTTRAKAAADHLAATGHKAAARVPSPSKLKNWVIALKNDVAAMLPSKRQAKHHSEAALAETSAKLRELQAELMELKEQAAAAM